MAGYYRMSDVLAFPSTTDTQGLVLLEDLRALRHELGLEQAGRFPARPVRAAGVVEDHRPDRGHQEI